MPQTKATVNAKNKASVFIFYFLLFLFYLIESKKEKLLLYFYLRGFGGIFPQAKEKTPDRALIPCYWLLKKERRGSRSPPRILKSVLLVDDCPPPGCSRSKLESFQNIFIPAVISGKALIVPRLGLVFDRVPVVRVPPPGVRVQGDRRTPAGLIL
jgi:hypothetical protein